MRKILIVFILTIFTSIVLAQKTENVIIIIVDGARYSETFGDETHQYIPKMWNQMKPNATIYTSFYNNGTTSTCSGHSSIITGTWQNIMNDGSERPHSPTCFEYFRKHSGYDKVDNYVVLGKDKLNILAYSDHLDYDSIYGASVIMSSLQYSDTQSVTNLKEVITNYHPKLMITNFPEVDNKGHSGILVDYLNAISQVDSIVYNIWNFIQSDPIYSNKTTLIITNDHGRHTTNFTSHGDDCEGCRHIMLMIIGPDTPKGIIDEKPFEQIDILPTIGKILNFPTPFSVGSVIRSAIDSLSIIYDTTHVIINDTIITNITDTIYYEVYDTVPVIIYDTVIIVVADTANIIVYDTVITVVADTSNIIVYDTIFTNIYDTTNVLVYDTIFTTIHDTTFISVSDTLIIDVKFENNIFTDIESDIKVYPNPTRDKIVLEMNENNFLSLASCSFHILDINGKQIFSSKIANLWYELNLSDWGGSGTYFLKIIDDENKIICTKTIILY